jgi:hypothetical protein
MKIIMWILKVLVLFFASVGLCKVVIIRAIQKFVEVFYSVELSIGQGLTWAIILFVFILFVLVSMKDGYWKRGSIF